MGNRKPHCPEKSENVQNWGTRCIQNRCMRSFLHQMMRTLETTSVQAEIAASHTHYHSDSWLRMTPSNRNPQVVLQDALLSEL